MVSEWALGGGFCLKALRSNSSGNFSRELYPLQTGHIMGPLMGGP